MPRDGYYGKKGTVLKAYPASSDFLLSYARAYTLEQDAELWQATQDKTYLNLAEKVADNIVSNDLHNGFFMNSAKLQYAAIDSIDPYALLALEATLKNMPQAVAPFLNGSGFTEGAYRMPDGSARVSTRDEELFALKEGEQLTSNGKQ